MIAAYLSTLLLCTIAGRPPQDYYTRGKELASFSLKPDGNVVRTGIKGENGAIFIMTVSGVFTTPGGRAADAFYLYQNPHQPESLPLPSFSSYIRYQKKDSFSWDEFPFWGYTKGRPSYSPSHTYEVYLQVFSDKDMGFGVPATYWDYPRDQPKDYIAGTIEVKIFEAIPQFGPRPPKLEVLDGSAFFSGDFEQRKLLIAGPEMQKIGPATAEFLATKSSPVEFKGVAADGVSPLLIRAPATGTGNATLTLQGEGGLYPTGVGIFDKPGKKTLTLTPHNRTVNGKPEPWVFALYRPPSYFGKGTGSRTVALTLDQTAKGKTDKIRSNASFALVRPPIVLVHGTYDNPKACWVSNTEKINGKEVFWPKSMLMRLKDEGFTNIFLVDWESTNGSKDPSDFKTNERSVWENKDGIRAALMTMRSNGFAATQADLVCHSQGGVISRVFAKGRHIDSQPNLSDEHYWNPENCRACFYHSGETFKMGSIHSLITISSTHRGSDVCRLLEAYKKYKDGGLGLDRWWMGLFVWYVDNFESGITTGGFHDQTPGAPRLTTLGPTPVPAHAIAATAADEDMHDYGALYIGRLKKLWGKTPMDAIVFAMNEMGQPDDAVRLQKLHQEYENAVGDFAKNEAYNRCLYALREAVFGHDQNDCTVALKSSLGGLSGGYATQCPRMLHGYAPRHATVQDAVIKVLHGGPDFLSPKGFPDAYTGEFARWQMPDADPNAPKAKPPLIGPEYQPPFKPRPLDPDIPAPNLNSVGSTPPTAGAGSPAGAFNRVSPPSSKPSPSAPSPGFNPAAVKGNIDELRALAEGAPDNASAQAAYAAALLRGGRLAEAEEVAKAAVKIDKSDPAPRLVLALTLVRQGKHDKAEAHYRECLLLDYKNPHAHAGLASCMALQKKWPAAERSYREAVRLSPSNGAWRADHALALYRLNRIPEAKREAQEARRLGVKSHPVYAPLGLAK